MNGNIGVNEKSFDYEVLAQLTNIFNRTFEQINFLLGMAIF